MRLYRLKLSGGIKWLMTATEGAHLWLDKFAWIMGLKEYRGASQEDGYSKIIFTKGRTPKHLRPTGRPQILGPAKFRNGPNAEDVICEFSNSKGRKSDIVKMWAALYPIYKNAAKKGCLPIHGGLVEKGGKGFLIAAPSNTGKSTCCRRIPPPWRALCDDETLIAHDEQVGFLAHPFPTWSGHLFNHSDGTFKVERCLPLSAIFFLARSKKDEAMLLSYRESAAFTYWLSAHIFKRNLKWLGAREQNELKYQLFLNSCELAKSIPSYILRTSLAGRFWERMEEALSNV